MSFLSETAYGNTMLQWSIAFGISVGLTVLLYLFKRFLASRFSAFAQKTVTDLDDLFAGLLQGITLLFILGASVYIASFFLVLSRDLQQTLDHAMFAIICFQIGMWGNALIAYAIGKTTNLQEFSDASTQTTLSVLRFIGKLILWAVLILLILDNIGFNITTLIASLGIGGIALALAAQNVLGDLFASLSIAMDKPFIIGDFIIIDSYMGTIEKIGMRTTHIRSLSGELIIFSNTDLLRSRVRNYKRMSERRIVFSLDVVYGTPFDTVETIPSMVRSIIENEDMARFDRGHFQKYGASSLVYEFVYYVLSPEYQDYMDVQQRINLAIYRCFGERDIEFAFPTQTISLPHGRYEYETSQSDKEFPYEPT